MKRILLTTYPGAFLYHGGGEREIFLLRDALNQVGFIADLYGPDSRPIHEYDTVIHFSLAGGAEALLDQMATDGRQMILWPNLWFVSVPSNETVENLQHLIDRFQVIVFKSKSEECHFRKYFDIDGKDIVLVNPAVSVEFSSSKNTTLFSDVYGVKNYIFWPGIIEPQKNQLAAVNALRDLDVPVVISGDVRDSQYFELCKKSATENFLFLPEMPFASEIYLSALTNSKVFLELPLDFPGVSAIEAELVGCNLILSDGEWSREHFEGRAEFVNPNSLDDIRRVVQASLAGAPQSHIEDAVGNKCFVPKAYDKLYDFLAS